MSEAWCETLFGEIADFKNGINFKTLDSGHKVKFLGVGDFQKKTSLEDISPLKSVCLSSKPPKDDLLKKNDLVFVRSNGSKELVGRCLHITCAPKELTYSGFCIRARLKSNDNFVQYINLLMQKGVLKKQLVKDGRGTNISNLNQKILSSLNLLLPPLPEQKAIADLISTWDDAIETTERLIKVKMKRLRQTAKWLLFGHKRINKKPSELVDSHFYKYPFDWDLVKIGKIAKEVSARNGESDETVLSCSKYDGFVNSLDYFGKQVFSSDTSNYKVIKKSQFGYPSNHIEEGSIGLLEHCKKGIVSPIYVIFEASPTKVHPLYLFKLLKTDIYKHIFQVKTSSSVDRRGSLRWGEFSKIKIPLPPLEEQQQIAESLSIAQQEIDLLKQLAEKYKTQKRGLMQKLLTGEWRVKPEIINQYMET